MNKQMSKNKIIIKNRNITCDCPLLNRMTSHQTAKVTVMSLVQYYLIIETKKLKILNFIKTKIKKIRD